MIYSGSPWVSARAMNNEVWWDSGGGDRRGMKYPWGAGLYIIYIVILL